MREELKDFVFDVLGDLADPKAFRVEEDRKGNLRVITLYKGLLAVPQEMIEDEWERQTKGTKFENVPLYFPA